MHSVDFLLLNIIKMCVCEDKKSETDCQWTLWCQIKWLIYVFKRGHRGSSNIKRIVIITSHHGGEMVYISEHINKEQGQKKNQFLTKKKEHSSFVNHMFETNKIKST